MPLLNHNKYNLTAYPLGVQNLAVLSLEPLIIELFDVATTDRTSRECPYKAALNLKGLDIIYEKLKEKMTMQIQNHKIPIPNDVYVICHLIKAGKIGIL